MTIGIIETAMLVFLSWFIIEGIRHINKEDKERDRKVKELIEKRKTDPDYNRDGNA